MAAGKTKHKALWLVLGSFIGLIILVIAIIGGKYYMEKQRATQLYQHGFKLYEEQIATYIKEHYSGVKKIEFSPIFIRRGGMSNANIVPVIYDEHGHKEILGDSGKIDNVATRSYGLLSGINLDLDGATNEEIIELLDTDREDVEVQNYKHLPNKAKWSYSEDIDDNISELVKQGYLKGIEKSTQGSPHAKIIYNLEIKEGDYTKWH
ncbi:TPA: hypothetical protein ACPQXA_000692 [Streptococcus mutans]|uniref:hypothetical protein n=1 Tax=Streptococcus mutans TaxID=1309 RepID=UPI0002B57D26|nr:hypothetical protein [Streptococcus mutans]EMC41129.1 hypothetical protein SMU97_09584 [Streptococcus mutans SM4]